MTEVIIYGSISAILFITSVVMFIIAIAKKKVNLALWALVPFVLAGTAGAYTGYVAITKAYDHVSDKLKARTGDEIYTAILGTPEPCVVVEQSVDQVVPRIDPAIFIQARVCPEEVRRLLASEKYEMIEKQTGYMGESSFPKGFEITTDSVLVFTRQFDQNNGRTLIISKDSTQLLMIDWLD